MSEITVAIDPYIQRQIEARSRPAVIKIRFLTFRSRYPDGLTLVIEGDDDRVVFSHWIRRIDPELGYEFFVAGGKRSIRQLVNSLAQDQNDSRKETLFLVDRDFDDLDGFCDHETVFMLEYYAVENYLVDPAVLESTLKSAYPGHVDPAIRRKICEMFSIDYSSFLNISADLNRRIFVCRRLGAAIDDYIPNSLGPIAQVNIGNVVPSNNRPDEIVPADLDAGEEDLQALHAEFDGLCPETRYRGKFAFKFLRAWTDKLADEFRNPRLGLFPLMDGPRGKVRHDEFGLGPLACRSRLPDGLSEFLKGGSNSNNAIAAPL